MRRKAHKTDYFNPRAPRGARQRELHAKVAAKMISIHGLRGEPDLLLPLPVAAAISISIHGLRGEPDATGGIADALKDLISIHGLRGEPDVARSRPHRANRISIHGLRGEPDRTVRDFVDTI